METETMLAVIWVSFFITVGSVAILRPIAVHLGAYLQALTKQKQAGLVAPPQDRLERIEAALNALHEDLARAREDREFYEKLFADQALPLPPGSRRLE